MAEMHLGLAADIAQENRDQGGVLAMLPFPGEGDARGLVQHLEFAARHHFAAVGAVHDDAVAAADTRLQQHDIALNVIGPGPGVPFLLAGEAGKDAGGRGVEGAGDFRAWVMAVFSFFGFGGLGLRLRCSSRRSKAPVQKAR